MYDDLTVSTVLQVRERNNVVLKYYVHIGVQIGWKNNDVIEIFKILEIQLYFKLCEMVCFYNKSKEEK